MTDTPEVHQVIVHIHLPSRRIPQGQIAYGYYTVVDGVVTMTDLKGEPAIDGDGKTYTHKLEPCDDAREIAGRLTKQLRLALRGESAGTSNSSGPINYPRKSYF